MTRFFCFLWISTLVFACEQHERPASQWQQIYGREAGAPPFYRVKAPDHWKRIDSQRPNPDTTKPLVEYVINEAVFLYVHNFPARSIEERIPPAAQVQRWKGQLVDVNPKEIVVSPFSRAGFAGLSFEAPGMLGWSLQLDIEHFQVLNDPQLGADVTIKAVGPADLLDRCRDEIISFAGSFELIEEIPSR